MPVSHSFMSPTCARPDAKTTPCPFPNLEPALTLSLQKLALEVGRQES